MPTISEALAIADQHYRDGRLSAAEQIYRQVLEADPDQPTVLHLLGRIAYRTGRYEEAVTNIRRAIVLRGTNNAAFHTSLGQALQAQGKPREAIDSFGRALQCHAIHLEVYKCLASAFKELGQLDEAAACYSRWLELQPDAPDAHLNLGTIFQVQQKFEAAVNCYRKAIELQPRLAKPYYNLGTALQALRKLGEAAHCYNRAIELEPNFAQAYNNLGNVYKDQGRLKEAVACFHQALKFKPDYASAYSNLGNVLLAEDKLEAAIDCFRHSLSLRPDLSETHNSLATALKDQGKNEEAIESYCRALELRPDYAQAHANCSMLRLLKGDYQRGWTEYEWRWKTNQLLNLDFSRPQWDGNPLGERTILLHAEQGLGDTIEFVRYAMVVKQQNPFAQVVVKCQQALVQLLANCPGIDRLVGEEDELPPFDCHLPFLSLPRILQTTVDSVPGGIPYVFAASPNCAEWRARLRDFQGLRIGINWRGRSGRGEFRRRDIALKHFISLAELPGIDLISLQKGEGRDELLAARPPIADLGADVDTVHGRFIDTAAIIMNLDLVITSDTSLPHLAGSLGVPVWVALPFVASWQWMCDRTDSPWYPTARLFRQNSAGDWAGVFSVIRTELERLVAGDGAKV